MSLRSDSLVKLEFYMENKAMALYMEKLKSTITNSNETDAPYKVVN